MHSLLLADIIGSKSAVSPKLGLKAFDFVSNLLQEGKVVCISLKGIEDMTSAFCNAFIGKLYMTLDPKELTNQLKIIDLDPADIWSRKVENARLLGTNDNARTLHKENLESVLFA